MKVLASAFAAILALSPMSASFTDVGPDFPFATEVAWAAGAGVVTGYDDGRFRPAAPLSRQALAAALYRYAGTDWQPPVGWPGYADVGPDHPFRTEIAWVVAVGLMMPYQDGLFRVSGQVSRPEVADVLHEMADRPIVSEGSKTLPFDDVFEESDLVVPITWVALHGIAEGYPDGTFGVTDSTSRQAFAAMLYRFEGWMMTEGPGSAMNGPELREHIRRELERDLGLGDGVDATGVVEGE